MTNTIFASFLEYFRVILLMTVVTIVFCAIVVVVVVVVLAVVSVVVIVVVIVAGTVAAVIGVLTAPVTTILGDSVIIHAFLIEFLQHVMVRMLLQKTVQHFSSLFDQGFVQPWTHFTFRFTHLVVEECSFMCDLGYGFETLTVVGECCCCF